MQTWQRSFVIVLAVIGMHRNALAQDAKSVQASDVQAADRDLDLARQSFEDQEALLVAIQGDIDRVNRRWVELKKPAELAIEVARISTIYLDHFPERPETREQLEKALQRLQTSALGEAAARAARAEAMATKATCVSFWRASQLRDEFERQPRDRMSFEQRAEILSLMDAMLVDPPIAQKCGRSPVDR